MAAYEGLSFVQPDSDTGTYIAFHIFFWVMHRQEENDTKGRRELARHVERNEFVQEGRANSITRVLEPDIRIHEPKTSKEQDKPGSLKLTSRNSTSLQKNIYPFWQDATWLTSLVASSWTSLSGFKNTIRIK